MNLIDYTYDSYYTQLGTSSLFLSLILIFPPRFHSLTDQHILDYGQSFHLPYYMYWMDKHLYIILVNSHYMKQYMCTYIIIYLCIYLCMDFNTYLCMHIYSYTYAVIFLRQIMVPVVEVKYLPDISPIFWWWVGHLMSV